MEWFIANQKSLVLSAFIFCAWILVQIIKQPIKLGTNKIKNKNIRNDVNIAIFVPLSIGAGFLFAYFYKLIYTDINLIGYGCSVGALTILSHDTIFKIFKNIAVLLITKFKARKDISAKEIIDTAKETVKDVDSEDSVDSMLDKLKNYE